MHCSYTRLFTKQVAKLKDKKLLAALKTHLEALNAAEDISQVANVKKLVGYKSYYRLRIQDYRLGIQVVEKTATLACLYHRKDIYKFFP